MIHQYYVVYYYWIVHIEDGATSINFPCQNNDIQNKIVYFHSTSSPQPPSAVCSSYVILIEFEVLIKMSKCMILFEYNFWRTLYNYLDES